MWAIDLPWIVRLYWHASGDAENAIEAVLKQIDWITYRYNPTRLVVASEEQGSTFRHKLCDKYKSHRSERSSELLYVYEQTYFNILGAGIPLLHSPAYEADDVLATVARQTVEFGGKCVLVSADKDLWQCLRQGTVTSYRKRNREWVFVSAEKAEMEVGLPISMIREYQALMGDSTDGVRGAEGIGPKTARALLSEYGSLDGIQENLDSLTPKKKESLKNFFEDRERQEKLVTLIDNVPLPEYWEQSLVCAE